MSKNIFLTRRGAHMRDHDVFGLVGFVLSRGTQWTQTHNFSNFQHNGGI